MLPPGGGLITGPRGPVAKFFRPVCELRERAVWANCWLWIEPLDAHISIYSWVDAGSAKRNSGTDRARKNFATGPPMAPSTCSAVVEGVRAAWAGRLDGYAKGATPVTSAQI